VEIFAAPGLEMENGNGMKYGMEKIFNQKNVYDFFGTPFG
jgi:hypothetical protein